MAGCRVPSVPTIAKMQKPESDLYDAVARKPANGFALLPERDRELWRQGKAVHSRERQHDGENGKLENQDLPVFGG